MRADIVQDIAMLTQFSVLGLLFGFMSLHIMHRLFMEKFGSKRAMWFIGGCLFLSSTAIYLGRELRWNSWDIALQPFAIVRDALYLWFDPQTFPNAVSIILSFFCMLASLYAIYWYGLKAAKAVK
jgi:uncharacterized membrane protein